MKFVHTANIQTERQTNRQTVNEYKITHLSSGRPMGYYIWASVVVFNTCSQVM